MKYITSIWTTVFILSGLLLLRIIDVPLVEQLRLITFDQYIKSLPDKESEQVIVLNIGENSLENLGQYPFPRQTYAQIISDLRNANAGMIGFTFMFPEPDRFGGDEVFASWIKDNGIILSQDADANGRSETAPYVGTAIKGIGDPYDFAYEYDGLVTNIPQLEEQAWGVGLINAAQEIDNITRRIPLISQVNQQLYPSFALEIIRVLQEKKSYTLNVEDYGIVDVMIPPYKPMKTDSNGIIWLNTNYTFNEIEYGEPLPDLKGKTILVGLSAKGISPQIPTPQGLNSSFCCSRDNGWFFDISSCLGRYSGNRSNCSGVDIDNPFYVLSFDLLWDNNLRRDRCRICIFFLVCLERISDTPRLNRFSINIYNIAHFNEL